MWFTLRNRVDKATSFFTKTIVNNPAEVLVVGAAHMFKHANRYKYVILALNTAIIGFLKLYLVVESFLSRLSTATDVAGLLMATRRRRR